MKLSEAITVLEDRLKQNPFFTDIVCVSSNGPNYNSLVETALRERGLAIVFLLTGASAPEPKSPLLRLRGEYMIAVLENPAQNTSGPAAIVVAEEVLKSLHQCTWTSQKGRQNEIIVDTPALEMGPPEAGLNSYFCHFSVLADLHGS